MGATQQEQYQRERESREAAEAGDLASGKRSWNLPPDVEAALEQRRIEGQIIGAVASMSWGKNLSATTRRAVAQYCMRYGIDPLTELDMLGGNPYPNSDFYLRMLGELRLAGIIVSYTLEHINADPDLLRVAGNEEAPNEVREWARREHWARWQKRRVLNADDAASAICVCTIILATGGAPVVGWKQGGGGTSIIQRSHEDRQGKPNPVIEDENNTPLAVESQAVRRAVRQIASHVKVPTGVAAAREIVQLEQLETDTADLAERVHATRAPQPPAAPEPRQLTEGTYNEAEALEAALRRKTDAAGRPEPIATVVERAAAKVARAPIGTDPYADPPVDSSSTVTTWDPAAIAERRDVPYGCVWDRVAEHAVRGRSTMTVCGNPIGAEWLLARGLFDARYWTDSSAADRCSACREKLQAAAAVSKTGPSEQKAEELPKPAETPATPTHPDVFGGETPLEAQARMCPECNRVTWTPSDHSPDCPEYEAVEA